MAAAEDESGALNRVLPALAGAAATAPLLGLAGRLYAPLDAFSHLAPLYLIAAGLLGAHAFLAALIARRTTLLLAFVTAAASLALIGPEYLDRPPAAAPALPVPGQLKIIQLNALRSNHDLARVARWVNAEQPNIVTITEARHDLRDRIVRDTGWKLAGEMGNLMIFTPQVYRVMNRPDLPKGSPLTFVNATYDEPGGPVEVVTAHLGWPVDPRAPGQVRDLVSVVERLPRERMILTGDFNAAGWSQTIRHLDRRLGLIRRDQGLATWPAQMFGRPWPLPFVPIDHVYAGPAWRTVSVERGPWLGSDHYPLVVTLAPDAGL